MRLATPDECRELFGAVPGLVPPLPLRAGVRVLCHPQLLRGESGGRSGGERGGESKRARGRPLWGSACEPFHRLWIGGRARDTLPALARAATRALEGARDGARAKAAGEVTAETEPLLVLDGTYDIHTSPLPPFAVLPDPALWCPSLDDALDAFLSRAAEGEGEGEGEGGGGGGSGGGGGGGAAPVRHRVSPRRGRGERGRQGQ